MRRLRLLTTLRGPDGDHLSGTEIVVDAAEAARLLGAIGLAEDLGLVEDIGPVEEDPTSPAKTPRKRGSGAAE